MIYKECSAKENINITSGFQEIANLTCKQSENEIEIDDMVGDIIKDLHNVDNSSNNNNNPCC